ncbi:MAG: substrate-binding protein [Deltaproteobacteria bacterium]|nr:substrate-binding protein [Deltaproteobacteria bacterium]
MKLFLRSFTAATLLFCSFAGNAQAAGPIKIGVPVGLSGANSVIAPAVVQASELAVEEINAAGGILGRKVELVIADDGSGAVGAQKAFDSLIFKSKVDVVIGMETSAARNAALPIVSRGRVPYLYTSFYEGHSCNRWMYINGWVPEQQSASVVDYLMKTENAKTFFLVGSDYAFGRGVLEYTKKYIRQSGGTVIGEEYLPMDGNDWTAIISKIRSSAPDALISCTAGGAPNVSLGKQIKSAGLSMPYGNMAIDEGTAKSMGADASGMLFSSSYITTLDTPENKAFLAAMEKKFGSGMKTPNDLSVPQYDGIYLYKAAVEKAGSSEAEKVIAAMGQVSVKGPRGVIAIDPVNRHAALNMYLGQIQADGSLKIIETFENVQPGPQCLK